MTGTNCDLFTHKLSRSYLNDLVFCGRHKGQLFSHILKNIVFHLEIWKLFHFSRACLFAFNITGPVRCFDFFTGSLWWGGTSISPLMRRTLATLGPSRKSNYVASFIPRIPWMVNSQGCLSSSTLSCSWATCSSWLALRMSVRASKHFLRLYSRFTSAILRKINRSGKQRSLCNFPPSVVKHRAAEVLIPDWMACKALCFWLFMWDSDWKELESSLRGPSDVTGLW